MAECPHCKKPLRIVKAGEFPVEQGTESKQTYLPVKDLEPTLEEYSKYVEFTPGEGVLFIRIESYIHDNKVWSAINKIITAHGGKYIKGGDKPGHWEVPT